MITCSCGYENQDTEKVCGMCKAPLKKVSIEEKKEEIKQEWSFTNVGAVKQTAGMNPLKAQVDTKGNGLKIFLIVFALTVFALLACAAYFVFIKK